MAEKKHRDTVLARLEQQAILLGDTSQFEECKYANEPRWRLDAKWVEFECGCRAERCTTLVDYYFWEPVIFYQLPEQAVYDYVCDFHAPAMNKRLGMGGKYKDFVSWRKLRRSTLMGKVR